MKKCFCIFLTMLLLCTALLPGAAAISTAAEEKFSVLQMVNDGLTYHWVNADGERVELPGNDEFDADAIDDVGGSLPATYYSTAVTAVKNQGESSACWSYSALSVLESNAIKKGLGTVDSIDFSEAHLAWFANRGLVSDTSDPTAGDGTLLDKPYDAGGSFLMAIYALARGAGITTEAKFPMNTTNYPSFSESQLYASDYRMVQADFPETRDAVKQAVIDNGGVAVCIYADTAGRRVTNTAMRNGATGLLSQTITAYNHKISYSPNHAVTIVGWDDSFSRSYFGSRVTPAASGAWLCKNSWGNEYDDNGYMWVSYEDATLIDYCTLQTAAKSAYDDIYQYDGYGYSSLISVNDSDAAYQANIFRAKQDCYLNRIGFYTLEANTSYNVYIYTDIPGEYTVPTDGKLAMSVSGNAPYAGYHTLELDAYVPLQGGERYSVVVEIPTARKDSTPLPVEGASTTQAGITINHAGQEKCSFIGYGDNGLAWVDTVKSGYNNTCVKAFTVNSYPGSLPAGIDNPYTITDTATGVRVICNVADFPIGAGLTLSVSKNTDHAAAIVSKLSDKYPSAAATAYDIAVLVNGRAVRTADSGFIVVLPVENPGAENIRAARTRQNGGSYSLEFLDETYTEGTLKVRVANLNGCLASVSYANAKIIDTPSISEDFSLLTFLKNLFRKIVDFFKQLFNIG